MAKFCKIVQIVKARGNNGEVVARALIDAQIIESLCGEHAAVLAVAPPSHDLPRLTQINTVSSSNNGELYLQLEGIDNRTRALELGGRFLLGNTADLPELALSQDSDFIGMQVIDSVVGSVGTIIDSRQGKAQALWVVDGPYGEVLVPAVDDFIQDVDNDVVKMVLPAGLLELNH